ncbi:MAG: response regulator transcription factor [Acidimicrobiales bacterium]
MTPVVARMGAQVWTPRLLVVEDEPTIAEAVVLRLVSEGFDVECVHDGRVAVERCAEVEFALIVLDLGLPGLDGIEVCRRIQAERPTPVVMLTARDDEMDLLVGLGVGADDYITKPFSPRELVARVRAVLRRVETAQAAAVAALTDPVHSPVLSIGRVTLDPARRLALVDTDPVHLTPTEFDLVHRLAQDHGRVFTREELLFAVWGYRDGSGARTVDSHVRSVRRKLGDDAIRTVHGVGYGMGTAQGAALRTTQGEALRTTEGEALRTTEGEALRTTEGEALRTTESDDRR